MAQYDWMKIRLFSLKGHPHNGAIAASTSLSIWSEWNLGPQPHGKSPGRGPDVIILWQPGFPNNWSAAWCIICTCPFVCIPPQAATRVFIYNFRVHRYKNRLIFGWWPHSKAKKRPFFEDKIHHFNIFLVSETKSDLQDLTFWPSLLDFLASGGQTTPLDTRPNKD